MHLVTKFGLRASINGRVTNETVKNGADFNTLAEKS